MLILELSCGLPPSPAFSDLCVLAEELGYARVWIFDSAPLWEDPFVHLALAAVRTHRIGLASAVLVPPERTVMTMASAVSTIARLSAGRFRACFGTGLTSRVAVGQPPITLDAMFDYVASLRQLLAGESAFADGKRVRMLHWPGMTSARPIPVPLWLSVFGPRGSARAPEIADGIIGAAHPTLPSATMVSGTVLEPGEAPTSKRVKAAVGPWRVVPWHLAYAQGGAALVDAMPGGAAWRRQLEELAPDGESRAFAFEGHVTHLATRDRGLLDHADLRTMVASPEAIGAFLDRLGDEGFSEVLYTPSGPDVEREMRAFAAASGTSRQVSGSEA